MSESYFHTAGGIQDHGFEDELVDGQFPNWEFSGDGTVGREDFKEYDGEYYAAVTAETQGDNYFSQDLYSANLEIGKTYILSFNYKIIDEDLDIEDGIGAKIQLVINGGDDDGTVYAATKPVFYRTGHKWSLAKVAFTAREEDSKIQVGMWGASGSLCIDNVCITPLEEQDGAALVNPDFEAFSEVGPAPFGWDTVLNDGTVLTVDDSFSGTAAVALERTESGTTICKQTISFPADKITMYKGSIAFKTEDVGNSGCRLRIFQTVENGTQDLFVSDDFTGTNDWDVLHFIIKTVEDASETYELTFELSLNDEGTAIFDTLRLRIEPLSAADFEDPNWQEYWKKQGNGTVQIETEQGSGKKLLAITNTATETTTVEQDFHTIEGLPYMIFGKAKISVTIPENETGGLYLLIYDSWTQSVVLKQGPFTEETESLDWSLVIDPDYKEVQLLKRYKLQIVLENCEGYAKFYQIENITTETAVMVGILPQPRTVDLGNSNAGITIGSGQSTLYIVHEDNVDDLRCANNLRTDLLGGDVPDNPNFGHYFNLERTITPITIQSFNPSTHKPAIVISDGSSQAVQGLLAKRGITQGRIASQGVEGYDLSIPSGNSPIILCTASTKAGRYYAVQSLLQLFTGAVIDVHTGIPMFALSSLNITDQPTMGRRAVHISYPTEYKISPPNEGFNRYQYKLDLLKPRNEGTSPDIDNRIPLEIYARLLSRFKINMIIIETPIFYCLDEQSGESGKTNLEIISPFFTFCRQYYIEPVPMLQSFGHAGRILQFKPNHVEACWVGGSKTDQRIPLPQLPEFFDGGTGTRHILSNNFVINTTQRPIKLFREVGNDWVEVSENNYTLEYNGINFDLERRFTTVTVNGGTEHQNCAITINGDFPAGTHFALHYHYANYHSTNSYSYCPSSQEIKDFTEDAIDRVVEELRPIFMHFGHDEPQQMHTCQVCNQIDGIEYLGRHITANGVIFSDDVNRLVQKYNSACQTYGIVGNRTIIYSDHVSGEQEKTTNGGNPHMLTPLGGGGGAVNSCRWRIDHLVMMMTWNYAVQGLKGEPPEQWEKYKFIQDLIYNPGFDVMGASAGYPAYSGPNSELFKSRAGAFLRTILYGPNGHLEFETLNDLEGTYQEKLWLNPGSQADGRGMIWFAWSASGYRGITTDKAYNSISHYCELMGLYVKGKAWFDYVELQLKDEFGNWQDLNNAVKNFSFETSGSGGNTFADWINPSSDSVQTASDTAIYYDGNKPPNSKGCRLNYLGSTDVVNVKLRQEGNSINIPSISDIRIGAKLRTQEVDTGRLTCPKQWAYCGQRFLSTPRIYRGGINLNFSYAGDALPHDEGARKSWKMRAGDLAVAEWCWSIGKPVSSELAKLWWDPFQILEKEVSW